MDIEKLLRGTPAFASRYELKELLGEGGMGAVFRARDNYRDRDVAIKVALHETAVSDETDSRMRKLWTNETRLAGKLRHPYVVELYEAGDAGAFSYLAMEVVDGGSLRSYVRADRLLPVERVIDAVFKVARALEYARRTATSRSASVMSSSLRRPLSSTTSQRPTRARASLSVPGHPPDAARPSRSRS